VPKCPDTLAPTDSLAPVLGLKCPRSEVSWVRSVCTPL